MAVADEAGIVTCVSKTSLLAAMLRSAYRFVRSRKAPPALIDIVLIPLASNSHGWVVADSLIVEEVGAHVYALLKPRQAPGGTQIGRAGEYDCLESSV
jgi:hypothetical protein